MTSTLNPDDSVVGVHNQKHKCVRCSEWDFEPFLLNTREGWKHNAWFDREACTLEMQRKLFLWKRGLLSRDEY